jgi:hypothetical protein
MSSAHGNLSILVHIINASSHSNLDTNGQKLFHSEYILKGSEVGVEHPESRDLWTLSIGRNSDY